MFTKDIEKDLLRNFVDFLNSGEDELKKQRYNPAVNSFFKAVVIYCDLKIYKKTGMLPKNHQERFLLLETHFPEAYKIVSGSFKKYTDSYNLRMEKADVLLVKEDVEKIKKIFGTEKES